MRFDFRTAVKKRAIPMARPRAFSSHDGEIRVFQVKECEDYKLALRINFSSEMTTSNLRPLDEPSVIEITYYFTCPESWSARKKFRALWQPCQNRDDLDNLDKAVLDAMHGIVISDDHKVAALSSFKIYGQEDKIVVRVRSWESFVWDPILEVPEIAL
jgi:Holliday junction resolvase RusA-like endonuclease